VKQANHPNNPDHPQQPQIIQQQIAAPLAYSIPEAMKAASVGRSKLYDAIASGELRARKLGSKNLILHDDLRHWLEGLPFADASTVHHDNDAEPVAADAKPQKSRPAVRR
jgi:excisionase family DNA binding protein